ncbi:MAG: tetratricopeptide repeat protein [Balneolaceae bacterium]
MDQNHKKIARLARFVQRDPTDSFSKFALALELLKNNEGEKALQIFESIYRLDPGYLGIYYHLGKLYETLEQNGRARKLYLEGAELARSRSEQRTLEELEEALQNMDTDRNETED